MKSADYNIVRNTESYLHEKWFPPRTVADTVGLLEEYSVIFYHFFIQIIIEKNPLNVPQGDIPETWQQ